MPIYCVYVQPVHSQFKERIAHDAMCAKYEKRVVLINSMPTELKLDINIFAVFFFCVSPIK